MKLQTSVEFLIILSAVALLCLFALASYSGVQGVQHSAYLKLGAESANAPVVAEMSGRGVPGIYAVFANTSYINKENQLDVILSYRGSFEIESISVQAPYGVVSLPSSDVGKNYSSIGVLSFSIIPQSTGEYNLTVYANVIFGTSVVQESTTAHSYALQQGGGNNYATNQSSGQSALSAYISQRNESVSYPFAVGKSIYTFSTSTHCAWHNFWGDREPESAQCGAGSWGVVIGDGSCNSFWYNGDDRYYCFYASGTGSSAGPLGQSATMAYNSVLHLANSTLSLHGAISDRNTSSPLMGEGNIPYGDTTVLGAYLQGALSQPYQLYGIRNISGILSAINLSEYSNYSIAESNLLSTLETYNGTWVGGDTMDYIDSQIKAVNSSARSLIGAPAQNVSSCRIARYEGIYGYECVPYSPLAYDIVANVLGVTKNQSIPYEGSLITVK